MRRRSGLDIPWTLEDACDPATMALIVYDMQAGVLRQLPDGGAGVVERVSQVLTAARAGGYPVFFTRHMSLPVRLMGRAQLRTAMAWQRVDDPEKVQSWFLPGSPGFGIVADLSPRADEAVFDKLALSAFAGTPLEMALRDLGIRAFAIGPPRPVYGVLRQLGGDRLDARTAPGYRDSALIRCAQGRGVGPVGAPREAGREHHVVGMADPDRHVVNEGDACSAAVHGDREQHDHPVLRSGRAAGSGLVGDQVALAEDDQLAVDGADRLDDMDVLADDGGDVG